MSSFHNSKELMRGHAKGKVKSKSVMVGPSNIRVMGQGREATVQNVRRKTGPILGLNKTHFDADLENKKGSPCGKIKAKGVGQSMHKVVCGQVDSSVEKPEHIIELEERQYVGNFGEAMSQIYQQRNEPPNNEMLKSQEESLMVALVKAKVTRLHASAKAE